MRKSKQTCITCCFIVAATVAVADGPMDKPGYWYESTDCSGDYTYMSALGGIPEEANSYEYEDGRGQCYRVEVVVVTGTPISPPSWLGLSGSYTYSHSWNAGLGVSDVGYVVVRGDSPTPSLCGDGSSDADCTCTAGQTKYRRESDGLHVCVTPPPFADVCTAHLKGGGFTEDEARPVCEYFVGNGTFPLPSWAIEQPWLWTVNMQIAMSCAVADKVDYMIGVGGFTVAALKGIAAANFYDIGLASLGRAALRFSGIASLVGFSGSTISEVCDLVGYGT